MTKPTTEARRHGEESGDREIGKSGNLKGERTAEARRRGENQKPTTEARRHGERSEDRETWKSGNREIGREANSYHEVKISHAACNCHPERVGANATPSRRTPTAPVPEYVVSGSSYEAADLTRSRLVPAAFKKMVLIICATLREIFDESAYDRFLLRTRTSRSVASYRDFTRERDAAMLKKSRCC